MLYVAVLPTRVLNYHNDDGTVSMRYFDIGQTIDSDHIEPKELAQLLRERGPMPAKIRLLDPKAAPAPVSKLPFLRGGGGGLR